VGRKSVQFLRFQNKNSPTLHEADRAFGACWRRGNALWSVPAGKGAFHAVGAAAYAYR